MRWSFAAVVVVLPLLAAACGGGGHTTVMVSGEQECANAWNASSNTRSRSTVARLLRRGYARLAGISLIESDAIMAVNPSGCFVVIHDRHHAVAYSARRTYDVDAVRFAFVSH